MGAGNASDCPREPIICPVGLSLPCGPIEKLSLNSNAYSANNRSKIPYACDEGAALLLDL